MWKTEPADGRTAFVAELAKAEFNHSPSAKTAPLDPAFPWDARHLLFTVREPSPTRTTGASLLFGRVTEQQPLIIESQMGENGVIFSDGIEADFLDFNSDTRATITLAERRGRLVV